ncbi:hypothetical protein C4568_03660 [Candidatus Parcubacteria bacterium]|nr:MAG: hypothetical protein C4568_03660 [Candidatus Parcubacteria bacterium]
MKYFRVKIGYGKDDFISVDETELPTAIRAQITGKVGVFREGTVSGNHIQAILPDLQRAAGFHRDYQLTGEDYEELRDTDKDHKLFLGETKDRVTAQIAGKESPTLPSKELLV